jgi:hypothetical protein
MSPERWETIGRFRIRSDLDWESRFGLRLQRAENVLEFVSFDWIEPSCHGRRGVIIQPAFVFQDKPGAVQSTPKQPLCSFPVLLAYDMSSDVHANCSELSIRPAMNRWLCLSLCLRFYNHWGPWFM